jgi:hypothetical protein
MANKDGSKSGGRKKGTPNRKTLLKQQAVAAAAAASPLEFLLAVMRSPLAEPRLRLDAAKAALPFLHAKPKEETPEDATLIETAKEPLLLTDYEICERYDALDSLNYEDVLEHYRVRGGEPPSEAEWCQKQKKL